MQIICQALLHPGRFLFKIRMVIPQRMRVEILVIAVTEFRAAEYLCRPFCSADSFGYAFRRELQDPLKKALFLQVTPAQI